MQRPKMRLDMFLIGSRQRRSGRAKRFDQIDQVWGMDIIVCTSAKTDDEARALLKAFNFPFRQ